jgi:hypothetical protein
MPLVMPRLNTGVTRIGQTTLPGYRFDDPSDLDFPRALQTTVGTRPLADRALAHILTGRVFPLFWASSIRIFPCIALGRKIILPVELIFIATY